MACKRKRTADTTAHSKQTFSETLLFISRRYSLFTVFDDFLTMTIAACTQNPLTKQSWYEEEYMATIAKYKDTELRHEFPKALACLIMEMEERVGSSLGTDILGEFFEQHISNGRNGQFFTPYPICQFMAAITHTDTAPDTDSSLGSPLRILDPTCGSGRMLLAAHRAHGVGHEYYGIDIDRTCVKMAAINLFFNGVWNSEVMCANSLLPDDFVIAYRITFLPLGIFKIEEREQSRAWRLYKNSFDMKEKEGTGKPIVLDATPFSERKKDNNSTQLGLF